MKQALADLDSICLELRKRILKIVYKSGSGHLTSSYSCLEILSTLYFGGILRYDPNNPKWEDRDYVVLSKGHAAMALYSIMAKVGFIEENELYSFCSRGSRLGGHPRMTLAGVDASSGSLGHGLPFAAGLAKGLVLKNKKSKVFCITGDGELQEGSNWEAAMFIAQNKLTNLIWIIDDNNLQIAERTSDVISLESLYDKINSFGFETYEVNGHDCKALYDVLIKQTKKPLAIIAKTEKGHGLPSIAGKPGWHARKPSKEELDVFLSELGMTKGELE
jgi:transketolase